VAECLAKSSASQRL